jgi:hypothetical protein
LAGIHKNGGLFFGIGRGDRREDAGVQGIGTPSSTVTPGDDFELARQTSGHQKLRRR